MKFYVAYKYLGEDHDKLKENLVKVLGYLEKAGIETFNFLRDIQNWGEMPHTLTNKEIIESAFKNINSCDAVLAVIASKEKSAGMLLEVGYARAMNKKINLAVDEKVRSDVDRFLIALADKIVEFQKIEDLEKEVKEI